MKRGLYGQQLTVMEELKAETFLAHARLQAVPFFQALAACQLPLESYVGQLRALATVHEVLEQALESCTDPRVASVWNGEMRKGPLLQQDLRYFEPRAVADLREAVEAALTTAEYLRLRSLEEPLSLLGCLYVLEGSTQGAVVLRPLFARAFLLTGEEGLAYLNAYGSGVHARWVLYSRRMNALGMNVSGSALSSPSPHATRGERVGERGDGFKGSKPDISSGEILALSAEERAQITQSANDFFAQLEAIFQALYPFQPESKTFLVTSINAEAGRHPVPAEAREVQAALRAADLCWQRFPYFEHRYGERGRRFARSDAAWLATLCQYEPVQITQQVQWLGRVLAARGMPTFLLQDQLQILAAELSAGLPEKKPAYEKFAHAAAELATARRRHLTDQQLETLAAEFDHAVGPEWSARFPHTGTLLASAVADELNGSENAVESLRPWLTDPTRFSSQWIVAVEAILSQARHAARPAENRSAAGHPHSEQFC